MTTNETPEQRAKVNGDSPAAPALISVAWCAGLTKREVAAIAVMQGFAADPNTTASSHEALATAAVQMADALLLELARRGEA